jgi:hypothetical protein
MVSRFTIALPVAMLGAALLAPNSYAQGHGMRVPEAAPRSRSAFGIGERDGIAHASRRRFLNSFGFFFSPYFYPDANFEDERDIPEPAPVQVIVEQPAPAPPPVASPVEPLLLEIHDGKWMRVPTGSQLPTIPSTAKPDSAQTSIPHPGFAEAPGLAPLLAKLPPAVVVFRDGRVEELGKYMIQGDTLFTNADYWTTGSWTRKIPLKELDIPASLKLNKERGSKFNLPSSPNEVVVRF